MGQQSYLNSSGHVAQGGVLACSRRLAALSGVVFTIDEMIARTEGHQMSVVGRGWDRDGPRAADIGVTHLKHS